MPDTQYIKTLGIAGKRWLVIAMALCFTCNGMMAQHTFTTDSFLKMSIGATDHTRQGLNTKPLYQGLHLDSNSINANAAYQYLEASKTYAAAGQFNKAYDAYAIYMAIKDSLFNIEKEGAIRNLENNYATTQKDKEITEKQIILTEQRELSRRKSTWITAISVGGIFIFMLCIISYRNYRNKQVIYQKALDRELKDQEISLLNANRNGEEIERENIAHQLQINIAHNLSHIQSNFLRLKERFPALKMSTDFKHTLQILEDAQAGLQESVLCLNPPQLTRNGLLETVQSFVNNIRTTENLEINLAVSGEIFEFPIQTKVAIYRIVQELIQNVIKHANASYAEVKLVFRPASLLLSVVDNGKGFDSRRVKDGIGLANIHERIQSLNGTIRIQQRDGTSVLITLPKPVPDFSKEKVHEL